MMLVVLTQTDDDDDGGDCDGDGDHDHACLPRSFLFLSFFLGAILLIMSEQANERMNE
jgi:hypothetical protein